MSNTNVEQGHKSQPAGTPPPNAQTPDQETIDIVDLRAFAERGEKVPPARQYKVQIDSDVVTATTSTPTGAMLLQLVGKRPCAYELIQIVKHHKNDVVHPNEVVDLQKPGLERFITAQKEIVTIFINGDPYEIPKGDRTVAELLSKVGETPEGYMLLQEKDGPPLPVPSDVPVKISGCEVFHSQPQTGASS